MNQSHATFSIDMFSIRTRPKRSDKIWWVGNIVEELEHCCRDDWNFSTDKKICETIRVNRIDGYAAAFQHDLRSSENFLKSTRFSLWIRKTQSRNRSYWPASVRLTMLFSSISLSIKSFTLFFYCASIYSPLVVRQYRQNRVFLPKSNCILN